MSRERHTLHLRSRVHDRPPQSARHHHHGDALRLGLKGQSKRKDSEPRRLLRQVLALEHTVLFGQTQVQSDRSRRTPSRAAPQVPRGRRSVGAGLETSWLAQSYGAIAGCVKRPRSDGRLHARRDALASCTACEPGGDRLRDESRERLEVSAVDLRLPRIVPRPRFATHQQLQRHNTSAGSV